MKIINPIYKPLKKAKILYKKYKGKQSFDEKLKRAKKATASKYVKK